MNDFNIDPRIIAGTLVNNELVEELKHIRKTLFRNAYNNEKTEYAFKIEWKRFKERKNAFWKRNFGLFASRLTQCSLEKQPTTIKFIEECFKFKFQID